MIPPIAIPAIIKAANPLLSIFKLDTSFPKISISILLPVKINISKLKRGIFMNWGSVADWVSGFGTVAPKVADFINKLV